MSISPELIAAVTAAIAKRDAQREGAELKFRCPDPTHHENGDAHVSARWNAEKGTWYCDVGGIGGGALDLAKRLGVPLPGRVNAPSLEQFAAQRGLTVAILQSWKITPVVHARRPALRYPTPVGVDRIKYTDGVKPKYRWAEKGKGGRIHWYGLERAVAALRAGEQVLYILNGEPATWAAEARGVAAVCLAGGETARLTPVLVAELRGALGALSSVKIRVVYDADSTGHAGAPVAARALRAGGFGDVDALDVAAAVPGVVGADVDDLQRRVGDDLAAALAALPSLLADSDTRADGKYDQETGSVDTQPPAHPSCFGEDGRFVPARAGKWLLSEAAIRLGYDRRLWRYERGVYRPDGDDWAKQRVRELVGDAFRRQQLDQVIAWLRAQLPSLGHYPPTESINCRNGLLDWRTGMLKKHTPDILSTNQIPIAWNPQAACLTIRRFFAETIPWDALDLIEELLGYALYPGNPFRKAVLLFGPGFNGKSILLGLFRGLVGPENVAAVPLQVLSENRFAAADLFGALANICGDLDARAVVSTDLFKQITGGDDVRAERKFHDGFKFRSSALPLFSANELPRTADQTDAWFDRWIIIPMPWRFDGDKEDPGLADKLAAELEGLLVHAVTGLRRLMARGRFALPASVIHAGTCYRQTLDTVRAFVGEECHVDRDAWVNRAELYKCYRNWCLDGGRHPLANTTFNQHLVQAFGTRVSLRKRGGYWGWIGLGLGPDLDDDGTAGGRGDGADGGAVGATGAPFPTQSPAREGVDGRDAPSAPPAPDPPPNEPAAGDRPAGGSGPNGPRERFEV
jgi:P4 family phage/plasmid primase-like protien